MIPTPRGAVLETLRGIGLGARAPTRYVVLQSEELNDALATIVVAPIDETAYRRNNSIRRTAEHCDPCRESGCSRVGVIELSVLAGIPRDRFGARPVGRASAATMARLDAGLRLLLKLDE